MVTITPVDENNKEIFSMESLIGSTLLKDVKGKDSPVPFQEALKSNTSGIVALYFSASWCPPCQRFTPILIDFYNTAKAAKSGFEIVFVSSDRSSDEFDAYFAKMPWLSIAQIEGSAAIKTKLAETLGVTGIPAMAVLDAKTGEIISGGEARDDVMAAGGDKEKVAATLQKWKEAERFPMSQGPGIMGSGKAQNPLFRFLSFLAKNPMIIFGFMYFVKWARRQMVEKGYLEDGAGGEAVDDVVEDVILEQGSEF